MLLIIILTLFTLSKAFRVDAHKTKAPVWNLTSQGVIQQAESIILDKQNFYDTIAATEEPSVENVLVPTIEHENENSWKETSLRFYQSVSIDRELVFESSRANHMIEENLIEIKLREDLFQVYNKLWEKIKDQPELADEESRKYLEEMVKGFKRSGFGLSPEEKEEFKHLSIELSDLSLVFLKNIYENDGNIWFTREELDGVPPSIMENFEISREKNVTLFKVNLTRKDIIPILKYGRNQETRKKAYKANMNKIQKNVDIFKQIVGIRFRLAKLLGYNSYTELVLQKQMAKTEGNVLDFLTELREKLYPLARAELEKKLAAKNKDLEDRGLPPQDKLYAWDDAFYTNILLENEYKIDEKKISKYFPLEHTIDKILRVFEKIFEVRFIQMKPEPGTIWHEDVQQFAVYQNMEFGEPRSKFMGWLLFDLHSREGKTRNAAVFPLHTAYTKPDGTRSPSVTALLCNFPKKDHNGESFLKHSDVVTFLHELGHAMHHLFSQTKHVAFQGPRVPEDFVECPSQVMEFWAWSRETLKEISGHIETGEPLGDELIDELIRSKQTNVGLENFLHLLYSVFDMEMHKIKSEDELEKLDTKTAWGKLFEEAELISNENIENIGYTGFGHLVVGYESRYYGYLYSRVIAADIFHTLFHAEPMNMENGRKYRDIILKNGGAKDISVILEKLLGRKPSSEAFLREMMIR